MSDLWICPLCGNGHDSELAYCPPNAHITLLVSAAANADWGQVVRNGGPPCFHIQDGQFCLRAHRWGGHNDMHTFTTLAAAITRAAPPSAPPREQGVPDWIRRDDQRRGWCDAELDAAPKSAERQGDAQDAARDVLKERQRQIDGEYWSREHDDEFDSEALALAAVCYAMPENSRDASPPLLWPFDSEWWKPKDRRRDLVRAGALIVAEIERLDRAALAERKDAPT